MLINSVIGVPILHNYLRIRRIRPGWIVRRVLFCLRRFFRVFIYVLCKFRRVRRNVEVSVTVTIYKCYVNKFRVDSCDLLRIFRGFGAPGSGRF